MPDAPEATVDTKAAGVSDGDAGQRGAHHLVQFLDAARSGFAPATLQPGESRFNRREGQRIAWQKTERAAAGRDRLLHPLAVMSAQVVYDHDMTRAQDRRQDVLASQRRAGFPLERMAAYICG